MTAYKNDINDLKDDICLKRAEWRRVRDDRLQRKSGLLAFGYDKRGIRSDRIFKQLRKEQDALSKLIRHTGKRLNRLVAKKSRAE